MKYKATKKLFYNQYLYKISVLNELAHLFRTEFNRHNWNHCETALNDYMNQYHAGDRLTRLVFNNIYVPVDNLDLLNATAIYDYIKDKRDLYILRVDRHCLSFYTNDKIFIDEFKEIITIAEISMPDPNYIKFLKSNTNTILVNDPVEFEYKVTFNWKTPVEHLGKFLDNHPKKTKVGSKTRYNIDNRLSVYNNYIFVKDEKILLLLQMIVGTNIGRIDRLVYCKDIDKYE